MTELVTQAEFARMRNVSRVAVGKWVATGRIDVIERDGRKLIDPVAAAVALKGTEQRAREIAELLNPSSPAVGGQTLTDFKTDTERERSALLKLERLEREGSLVSRDQVEVEQETAARLVKKALDAIPSHAEDIAASAMDGGALAVRKALKKMVRDVQQSLSRAMIEAAAEVEAQRMAEDPDDVAA